MKRSLYVLFSVAAFASIVLAGCGPAPTQAPAATVAPAATAVPAPTDTAAPVDKVITIAYSQEPNNVVGEYSDMTFAAWLDQIVMAGLGTWNAKDEFVPDLAADVPTAANGGVSADGLTITWKLKPGLKWSDGEPLTSKDILFTYQTMIDPKNAPISRAGFDKITGIDTPDDQTAVIHFSSLYPAWQLLFEVGAQGINGALLPAHILQGKTGLEQDPEIHSPTVVSGPFMIKDWVAGDHMTLVPNPNYYGAKPKLTQINIKFVPDPETALAALKTGDVDLVPDFAESDIPTISALEPAVHLRVDATPSFEHLFFNLGTTAGVKLADGTVVGQSDVNGFCPFQDVNVRKAFMLATDRDTIVKTLLFGKTTVPASLWPNSYWYNTSLTPYPYDPDQANTLLDAAGYAKGADGVRAGTCGGKPVKFSLGIETTNKQVRIDTMNAMSDMYTKIGVELKPNPLPAGTYFGSYSDGADLKHGKFDLAIYTTGFYPDPDPGTSFLCSGVTSKANQSGQNDYHVCDPQMDALFAQGLASADAATRKVAYDAIQKYQYDNVIMIPLYARGNVYGYTDRFVLPPTSGFCGWACDIVDFDVK